MDPERREDVLHYGQPSDDDDDFDADIDTDQYHQQPPRERTPSPPPPPPAYHEPDWGGEPPEDEYEPVELDRSKLRLAPHEEVDEEDAGKWTTRAGREATIDDMDSSDDEYIEDDPRRTRLRRIRMQRYRESRVGLPQQATIDAFLEHPDLAIQPRFNDLPTSTEMDTEMRNMDDTDAWEAFWRLNDRNWCFFCSYKRRTLSENEHSYYKQIIDMWTRPEFDRDEEHIVEQSQAIFFVCLQKLLPPRRPCKRTGRPRPPHYLWKASIRRHFHEHEYRPTHDRVAMRNVLKEANAILSARTFKRHKKNPGDVQFDGQRLRHLRDNMELILKLDTLINKDVAQYRVHSSR